MGQQTSIRLVNEAFTPDRDQNFAINQLIKKLIDFETRISALEGGPILDDSGNLILDDAGQWIYA